MLFDMPNHQTGNKLVQIIVLCLIFVRLSSIQTTFRIASIQSITIVMLTKADYTDTVFISKVLLLFVMLLKLFVAQNAHVSYYF